MAADRRTQPTSTSQNSKEGAGIQASRRVRFRITRQDGPGQPSRVESFDVPVVPGMNVISCLQWICANPRTVEGRATTPPAWDCNCLEEVCGACTMLINGRVRQSCSCLIDDYAPNDGDEITLEPMSKFPVVRDLFVDRSRLFNDLKRIKAWVPIDNTFDMGAASKVPVEKQQKRYVLSTCMSCGCCLEACPQYLIDNHFVGAAPMVQTILFNEHEVGASLKADRLNVMMGVGGVNDCGNAQNCVKVCPKKIPTTESIADTGRGVTIQAFKQFFMGK